MSWLKDPEVRAAIKKESKVLGARWYQIATEMGPEPLESTVQTGLNSIAHDLLEQFVAEEENPRACRRLGQGLYELIGIPTDVVTDLQVAFTEYTGEVLPASECPQVQRRLMKLAGALGIGYLEAYHTKQRKLNVRELRKVRHDLKTPINAVTGFSKVILKGIDGPITKLQQEDLTTIFESGLQLLEMIDDLTTTIIRDEDKIALTTDTIDVAALIGDIIATAYPVINSRSCSLNVHLSDELGVLDAPLSPIRWVLLSPLLVLARAAQQHTVTLQISRSDIKNQELIIARITTEGISPEMFEKVKKAPTLVPTQRYCRKMGGTFELSADEGDGVCIYVQIPTVVPKDIM